MIELGVHKDKVGLMNVPLQFVQILTPLLIFKKIDLNRPFDLFLKIYPIRLLITLVLAMWIFITPYFRDLNNEYSLTYFVLYIILNSSYSFVFALMGLTKSTFFTRISDEKIGSTYMTLLNTVSNFGISFFFFLFPKYEFIFLFFSTASHWPTTIALYLIDLLSLKNCNKVIVPTHPKLELLIEQNVCSTETEAKICREIGGDCITTFDAFYLLALLCVLIGTLWLSIFKQTLLNLQSLPKSCWRVRFKE